MLTADDLATWARGRGLETVLIFLGAVLLARLVRWLALRAPAQLRRDDKHGLALAQALAWLGVATVWLIASIMILAKCNVPLASVVPPATVAGVAVAFGSQKLIADVLNGFFLFAERQLGYGDLVRVGPPGDSNGVTGRVEELTLRTTRLRTQSGDVVFIPNGEIRQLTNLSLDWDRAIVDVPVPASADIGHVLDLLRHVSEDLRSDPAFAGLVLDEPLTIGIEALDLGCVTVRVVARTRPTGQFEAARELRRRAVEVLQANDIALAGPSQQPGRPRATS